MQTLRIPLNRRQIPLSFFVPGGHRQYPSRAQNEAPKHRWPCVHNSPGLEPLRYLVFDAALNSKISPRVPN